MFMNNISLKSWGIYALIKMYNEENKKITLDLLSSSSKDGMSSVRSGIKELVDNGYLEVKRNRINGKVAHCDYKLLK